MGREIARLRLRCVLVAGVLFGAAIVLAGCSNDTSRMRAGAAGRSTEPSYPARPPAASSAAAADAPPRPAVESGPLPQVQPAYPPPPGAPAYGADPYAASPYAASPYAAQPDFDDQGPYDPYEAPPAGYAPGRATPPGAVSPRGGYDPPAARYEPARPGPAPPPAWSVPDYPPPPPPPPGGRPAPAPPAESRLTPPPARTAAMGEAAPAAAPRPPAPAKAPPPPDAAAPVTRVAPAYMVSRGDTLARIADRFHVGAREIAAANGLAPGTALTVGMRLVIPVSRPVPVNVQAQTPPRPPQQGSQAVRVAVAEPGPGGAGGEPAPSARVVSPVQAPPPPAAEAAPSAVPSFRWPARGRIINTYGARVSGATNDGIDLAVPEGTAVRSAEDGVVAYAGNELKGYGNLVLVRHAGGFVTAYANGSELLVKRNEQVHKGQVVMKSGQTGNAAAPQLHFEIRKNSAPVDPMQLLPSDRTASAPL